MTEMCEPQLINTGDIEHPTPLSQAILDGYAPGEELYYYPQYPEITHEELVKLKSADYPTVFYEVTKKLFGSAIPDEVLRATANEAYAAPNFDFDEDNNIRFTKLPSGVYLVGLSDGPTAAFKDMAMQPFARWMSYLQKQRGEALTILLSTSGDTGPAAMSAFSGLENTEIVCMFPDKGVSPFQKAQMIELGEREGVHALELTGDFSSLNNLQMEADQAFDLGAVNSVNIARIIAQIPYHVASYLKAIELEGKEIGDPVDVSIPSGNFGNALSAIIARKMGVPFRNIIVATNENNTLDTLLREGVFRKTKHQTTNSTAQDIVMPSNVWRYFTMWLGPDPRKIADIYRNYSENDFAVISNRDVFDQSVREGVLSVTITKDERAGAITDAYDNSDSQQRIFIDPHTANSLAAIGRLGLADPGVPMLAVETAKPFKFDAVMESVLGSKPPRPERFQGIEGRQLGKRVIKIASQAELFRYLESHTNAKPRQ